MVGFFISGFRFIKLLKKVLPKFHMVICMLILRLPVLTCEIFGGTQLAVTFSGHDQGSTVMTFRTIFQNPQYNKRAHEEASVKYLQYTTLTKQQQKQC